MGYSLKKLLAMGLQVDGEMPTVESKPRRQPGTMNKLEQRYSQQLELERMAGEIKAWYFEAIALRIGQRCFWHPDFLVIMPDDTIQLRDTKGHVKDDALVKAKSIASKFPFPVFHVKWIKKQWQVRRIG